MGLQALFLAKGYDVATAGRAVRALIRNPDDLPQVFTIIDALSSGTEKRLVRRLAGSDEGAALLSAQPAIAARLADRPALRALPEGSLGRAYLAFVEAEGISPEGILEASARGRTRSGHERSAGATFVHDRLRDTHDLWHAVTGYHGDIVGELALLAFSFAQTHNPGIALIVVAALAKGLARGHGDVVLEGYRRGRAARWLLAEDWESMLALPLEQVRARLRVGPVASYVPVRSDALRAAGVIAAA